jgi:cytochrome b6-f complex iron-sulfur subunit
VIPRELDRREVLAAATALVGLTLPALRCSGDPEPPLSPGQVAVPLADLREGERRIVVVGENPVEVQRTGDAVTARLLRCTHMGCVVRWRPEAEVYVCPCHDGRFDAEGRVLSGPPPRPLLAVLAAIRNGRVVVG